MYSIVESKKLQKAVRITSSYNTSSSSSSSYSGSSYSASSASAAGSGASAYEAVQISPQRVSLKLRISKLFIIFIWFLRQ